MSELYLKVQSERLLLVEQHSSIRNFQVILLGFSRVILNNSSQLSQATLHRSCEQHMSKFDLQQFKVCQVRLQRIPSLDK